MNYNSLRQVLDGLQKSRFVVEALMADGFIKCVEELQYANVQVDGRTTVKVNDRKRKGVV
ncbi:hypothetical protein [Abyssogena phaseoliformis symbiont]|uniref:hypothetical protein n=1 Tax=Abyssogena phaseoliformis symbiont TaxID=596095 RepID=UPI0019156907|nr:hypothetical protein [Abyssogena phaseoliformis symbiont]MBW5289475.1 hypothetical protein [Candidatus Ruthia sp. Apha_13_S6]